MMMANKKMEKYKGGELADAQYEIDRDYLMPRTRQRKMNREGSFDYNYNDKL